MTHIDICNLPENSCCGNCDLHREAIELLVTKARLEEREAMRKLVEGKKQHIFYPLGEKSSNMNEAYNKALSDILNELNKN